MNTIQKNIGVVALVIAIIALFTPVMPDGKSATDLVVGSVGTRFPNGLAVGSTATVTQNKLTVGNSGTAVGQIIFGTCTLVSDSSITATTTGTGTCAATGALAGDNVQVTIATTTSKMAAQWTVIGAIASTDSITIRLLNETGTNAVPSATSGFGSSTQYRIFR